MTPDRVHTVPGSAAVPRAVATPPSVYRGRGPIDPTPAPTRSHTLNVPEPAPPVIPASGTRPPATAAGCATTRNPVREATPPGVVTLTVHAPAASAGTVTLRRSSDWTPNDRAATAPAGPLKATALAPVRCAPVTTTT